MLEDWTINVLFSNKNLILLGIAIVGLVYYKRSLLYYGLISRQQIYDYTDKVVECLGGGEPARRLLLETCATETSMGEAMDTSWNVGIGLMQFDKIGFIDVQQRTPKSVKDKVLQCFGIDVDRATHSDLRWSPLLSIVFARLKYRLVPALIPSTIEGRAMYWKKWYNSELGAGTPEAYILRSSKFGLTS
jgi:hypothetical protein